MSFEQTRHQIIGTRAPALDLRTGVFALSPLPCNARSIPDLTQFAVRLVLDAFPLDSQTPAQLTSAMVKWERVLQMAEENGVAPLLYAAIKKSKHERDLPIDCVERLRFAYLRSDTANWLALGELESLLAEFERVQIPVIVLKGGALVTTLYPESALRPMADLDLLIPHPQFARAEAVMFDRGFASPIEMGEGYGPQLMNYRGYERHGKNPAHVELHWHLFKSPYYCQRVPIEWFWERATEITIGSKRARAFSREAQFLHLAAHWALHHRAEGLIWSYDLALMLARQSNQMDWDILLDSAERFGLIPALQQAVAQVAQTWGISIPSDVSTRLNAFRSGWRDRAAFTMMTAQRDEARFLLDAFSQPTVARMARFWIHHLFPTRGYMRERYSIRDERWLPLFYIWRLIEGSWKMLRSAISLITRR